MKFPGIKIIDRYIIRKFLGTYFFAIALIIVVVVIFDAAEKIDDFIELKAPLSKIVLQYYLNFIPFFINQFSGLFTFIAVIFFTSKLAYQTEIIAILSAGISFRRLMWPYILSAGAITLLSLVLNLVVIPAANGERLKFELNYIKNIKGAKYDPHIYRQIEPGTLISETIPSRPGLRRSSCSKLTRTGRSYLRSRLRMRSSIPKRDVGALRKASTGNLRTTRRFLITRRRSIRL